MDTNPLYSVGDRFGDANGILRVLDVVELPGIHEYCYRCAFEMQPRARPGLVWERQLTEMGLIAESPAPAEEE